MSKKFEEGDRVILTGEGLIPFKNWPVWGSKYSCVGTITNIRHSFVHVLWDNGNSKALIRSKISHFTGREKKSLSPNIAFMLYKRSVNATRKKRR